MTHRLKNLVFIGSHICRCLVIINFLKFLSLKQVVFKVKNEEELRYYANSGFFYTGRFLRYAADERYLLALFTQKGQSSYLLILLDL
jgi:hypothetical protein